MCARRGSNAARLAAIAFRSSILAEAEVLLRGTEHERAFRSTAAWPRCWSSPAPAMRRSSTAHRRRRGGSALHSQPDHPVRPAQGDFGGRAMEAEAAAADALRRTVAMLVPAEPRRRREIVVHVERRHVGARRAPP